MHRPAHASCSQRPAARMVAPYARITRSSPGVGHREHHAGYERDRASARGVKAQDQDPVPAALCRDRRHAVLALLASGQITLRRVDGWPTLSAPPPILTSPPDPPHHALGAAPRNFHQPRDTTLFDAVDLRLSEPPCGGLFWSPVFWRGARFGRSLHAPRRAGDQNFTEELPRARASFHSIERLRASAITACELARASKVRRVLIRAAATHPIGAMGTMQRNSSPDFSQGIGASGL